MKNNEDYFGETSSRNMPEHFFLRATRLDHSTAVRADVTQQDYSVCPRHWYVDAHFVCEDCSGPYVWSASEQKTWFQDFGFYVDSRPRQCSRCRARRRHVKEIQREYDELVARARSRGSLAEKTRVIELVSELEESLAEIAPRMRETKELFMRQVEKAGPEPGG